MSVIAINEQYKDRQGSEIWGDTGESLTVNRTRSWIAQTDNDQDTDALVLAFSSFPRPGDVHPADGNSRLIKRTAKQMRQGPRWWMVRADYTSKLTAAQVKQLETPSDNPVDRRVQVDWTINRYEKVVERDRINFPIHNAAGDPPDPPAFVPRGNIVATIQGNVLNLEPWILEDYPFSVNEKEFTLRGFDVGAEKAMLTNVSISDQLHENIYSYFRVTLEIEISTREQGHELWLLNQGTMQIDENNDKVDCTILDKNSKPVPVTSPVLLDQDGKQMTRDEIDLQKINDPEKFYIKYKIQEVKDWTVLGLPA